MITPDNKKTLTLLPENYRNETFDENLGFLKVNHPSLFNSVHKYKSNEYQLCVNPDGSPNILDVQNKSPIYPSFTMDKIMKDIQHNIDNLSCNFLVPQTFIRSGDSTWQLNNPIQDDMLNRLYDSGIFNDLQLTAQNLAPVQHYCTDYFPLLRVYGIGLGYHLTELIKQKAISYMTIYEPHIDLFYTSLFTIPWKFIFKYFDNERRGLRLIIGTSPEEAVQVNIAFIRQKLMPLTCFFYRYNHFNSKKIKDTIVKESHSDSVEKEQSDAGWYEDQRAGFYLSARNIKKGNKFFSGKKTNQFFRSFIVGSGPSLNETIDYIKTHQNDAIIFSCGSAITPLLNAGIIPDYEIIQERIWHFVKLEEKHDPTLLKKISLLKLNVVSPQIDKFYKETFIFQKFKDPGSSLLGDKYPVTTAVNPTVTNAAIAMCADLGVNEVYLFGVDYGAPRDSKKMHAANTIYDGEAVDDSVELTTNFDLPGNLGSDIRTTTVLSWSLQITEGKIAKFPNIKWFNVGEGAKISGASPLKRSDLPSNFSKKIQKRQLLEEIPTCFDNHYSPADIFQQLKTTHMQQVSDYFQALLGFTKATPQTREEIVFVLSLLYEAVNVGQNQTSFLPSSLLSNGFKTFITNVYIQSAMAADDVSAAHFFRSAMEILVDHIADIKEDLTKILAYVEKDSETDLLNTWVDIFS